MDPAVAATDVRKVYDETTALRGVSLSAAAGEVLALIGPNGAGKTTLVRCLTGTTAVDTGEVRLLGHRPRDTDANRIGLLPQDFSPPDRLTAHELLDYYAGLYDQSRVQGIDAVLGQVGIAEVADRPYRQLSGGRRRGTLVGTALVNNPDVLFLDEPTTGIDPAGRRAVWQVVETLAGAGTTIVLTTHSMEEAERLADRVGVLVDGNLAALGTPSELVATHGGPSRLVVRTGQVEAALDALGYLPSQAVDGGVAIDRLPAGRIGEVVETLDDAGVTYQRLSWSDPDLERVYLEVAGQAPVEAGRKPSPAEVIRE